MTANLKILLRSFLQSWKICPRLNGFSILLMLFEGFWPLIPLYLLKCIIDESLSLHSDQESHWLSFWAIVGLAIIGFAITELLKGVNAFLTHQRNKKIHFGFQNLMLEKSTQVRFDYFEIPEYHDTLHISQSVSLHRPALLQVELFKVGTYFVSLLSVCVLLFNLYGLWMLLFLVSFIPGIILKYKSILKQKTLRRDTAEKERKIEVYKEILSGSEFAAELRVFKFTRSILNSFKALREVLYKSIDRTENYKIFADGVLHLGLSFSVVMIVAGMSYENLSKGVEIGLLIMSLQALLKCQAWSAGVIHSSSVIFDNTLAVAELYKFLDYPEIEKEKEPHLGQSHSKSESLECCDLSFKYPTQERNVLDQVNFELKRGEWVGLVGANGSGKSTLIKILAGLYRDFQGKVHQDSKDLKDEGNFLAENKVSVMFQDYSKYPLTVRLNLILSDINRERNDEELKEMLLNLGYPKHELPELDQVLGRAYSEGQELSLGQWQKLALGRTLIKDADFYFLDEPFHHLDAISENLLIQVLKDKKKASAILTSTHRLSSLLECDRILVLEKGGISNTGTHSELIEKSNLYRRMCEVQKLI